MLLASELPRGLLGNVGLFGPRPPRELNLPVVGEFGPLDILLRLGIPEVFIRIFPEIEGERRVGRALLLFGSCGGAKLCGV